MVKNLRKIRKMRELTQSQLAEATGINKVTICKYEVGKVDPTVKSAEKLANALGCKIEDLIGSDSDAVPND